VIILNKTVLFVDDIKAWNFSWETPEEVAEALLEAYKTIKKGAEACQ
jgi:hypothetical protein